MDNERVIVIDTETTSLSGTRHDFAVIKVHAVSIPYLYIEMRVNLQGQSSFQTVFRGREAFEIIQQFKEQGVALRLDPTPLERGSNG